MNRKAINKLLSAIDRVANSNSFLLEFSADASTPVGEAFADFLKSGDFKRQMVEQDRERGWMNYSVLDLESGEYSGEARPGDFVVDDFQLDIRELGAEKLRGRLTSTLTSGKSFYRRAYGPEQAAEIVDEFLSYGIGLKEGEEQGGWKFYDVLPNFLYRKDLVARKEQGEGKETLAFFDGEGFDSCTLMRRGQSILALLTNGAP